MRPLQATVADFMQISESDGKAPSPKAAKPAAPCFGIEPAKSNWHIPTVRKAAPASVLNQPK
jgi:hypothetical protein